jgi:hypothetical protein
MTTYLIVYGLNPADRFAAYKFANRQDAITARLTPTVPVDGYGRYQPDRPAEDVRPGIGGCAYVIEKDEDVPFALPRLAEVFNALTGQSIARFRDKPTGLKRLFAALAERAVEPSSELPVENPYVPSENELINVPSSDQEDEGMTNSEEVAAPVQMVETIDYVDVDLEAAEAEAPKKRRGRATPEGRTTLKEQQERYNALAREATLLGLKAKEHTALFQYERGEKQIEKLRARIEEAKANPPRHREGMSKKPRHREGMPKKLSENMQVLVISESNPKRAGSKAAGYWEHYRNGTTVAELIAAGVPRADIDWNAKKGFITLG